MPDTTNRPAQQPTDSPAFSLTWLIRSIVVCALVVAPWLFGGIQASVQVWLYVAICVALGCWLAGQLTGRLRAGLPLAIIPLFCVIAFGGLQLVPASHEVNATLSPVGTQLRAELLGDELPYRMPLSQNPASTRADLALLILLVAVFALGSAFFATARVQVWLCWAVAINGAALAFFGLVQKLAWEGMLYWGTPCYGSPFGPFVNRNNGAGYLNLCLAGAVGVGIWILSRSQIGDTGSGDVRRRAPGLAAATSSVREHGPTHGCYDDETGAADDLYASADANHSLIAAMPLTAFSLAGCIVAGIVCALSRGAWIAMVGASLATAVIALWVRPCRLQLRAFTLVAVLGLSLVAWVGLQDSVFQRLGTLLDGQAVEDGGGRIPHWYESLQVIPDFWLTGSGLGTYRYIYPLYQSQPQSGLFYHAENQYLESLVDGGVIGLSLLLIMIGVVALACWRVLRNDPDPRGFAFGVAATFALASQAIHGYFDFGLYMPANAMLLALLCGAVCGRAARPTRRPTDPPTYRLTAAIVALLLAAGLWGWLETRRVAAVESARVAARFAFDPAQDVDQDVDRAVGRLAVALQQRPDDVEGQYVLAKLWVLLYRLRALDALRAEQPALAGDGRLWEATSLQVLHQRLCDFTRDDQWEQLDQLRVQPVVADNLLPAWQHLAEARLACPLVPESHLMTAQLCGLVGDPSDDQNHLARTRRLSPGYADLLYPCGLLEYQAGRFDLAWETWRRVLELAPGQVDAVLDHVGDQIRKPETIQRLLPDSPTLLIDLARQRYSATEDADIRRLLIERAAVLVERVDLPEGERCYLRGSVFALQGDFPAAVGSLQRAVQLRPQEAAWRYELALALQATSDFAAAREQAKWCVRTDPRNTAYRKLLEQVVRQQLEQTDP